MNAVFREEPEAVLRLQALSKGSRISTGGGGELATARVLIIDNEPMLVDLYTELLGRQGYAVLPADGPRQALEIVRRPPPVNVVLADQQMPGMLGTELVRQIADLSPGTACVLATGGLVTWAEMPPGVPLLRKPFLVPDLIAAVQGAVARSIELRAELRVTTERSAQLHEETKRLLCECREAKRKLADVISKSRVSRANRDFDTPK